MKKISVFVLIAFLSIINFFSASETCAQIVIQEKVEINPQTINPDYPISSLDPCPSISRPQYYQSVYSCSSFPIEPYQQLYPFQSGTAQIFSATTFYDAEIIAGTDYAYFERVAYIDSSGNSYPAETFGSLLSGLTGSELSGTGNFIGYEGPGTFERENPTVYRINFDNYSESEVTVIVRITNLNDNTYSDWHTLIVNPDLRLVNQQYEADTLLHYYSKDVTPRFINANFPCSHPGYGGCPPDNFTFNIEIIEGQQYGSIKSGLTGDISTSFTGIPFNELYVFTYYANGLQPDSTAAVRIRHSSSDAEIIPMEFSFLVKKNNIPLPSEGGSIYVKMNKEVVFPGDTVNVQLLWIDEVSDTIEFLPMQSFRVDLAEGSEYGTILDIQTGDTSDIFTEIGNMFKVIVEDQITPQEAKIIIVAEADLMIWSRPVRINNRDQDKENENSSEKVDDGGGITPDIIIIGDHLIGVGEIIITKTPFVVEIVPSVISAGDTAQIVPKKKRSDGTLEDFPPGTLFEIGMLEGCAAGLIHAAGDSSNYFYGVTQPIYFKAAETIEGESDTVKLLVGLIEQQQGGMQMVGEGEKEIQPEVKSNYLKSPPGGVPTNPLGFACFTGDFVEQITAPANVVVGDECDEEIVVCNNYQPPKFEDVSTITELAENDPWQWIDEQGNPQTTNASNGCNIIDLGEIGLTYIMGTIGDLTINQQPVYTRLDDMRVTACADKSNPIPSEHIWRFSVENMRIPIFRDHCPAWAIANDYVDLLDGTNADTLAKYIRNCKDYSDVMKSLEWWKKGFYYKTGPLPYKIYFSAGVITHENVHVKQIKDGGTKAFPVSSLSQVMNGPNGLPKLVEYNDIKLNVYKCPEDVLNSLTGTPCKVVKLKDRIKNQLNEELKRADKLKQLGSVDGQLRYNSELEADELARPKYDEIKKNIENWAKQQSWWCIPWPIVGDDYYRGCDKSDCTP